MCGIVGAIADRDVVPVLIEGLKRLEYRGYDSSGIAVIDQGERRDVRRVRRTGRVSEMATAAEAEGFNAVLGIGHTRWATHGGVTEANAHPHISHGVALVHNGIIENHEEQREKLRALGYTFESQTDTEVIAHLIHHHLKDGDDLLVALQHTVKELTGAYALAVVSRAEPERFVCARMGCPLLVGLGEGENFVASDVSAVISATRKVIFLEEGDTAEIRRDGVRIFDEHDQPIERDVHLSDVSLASLELGPYRHFMQKEIHEQPRALGDTIEAAIDAGGFPAELFGKNAEAVLSGIEGVQIIACGTSYYSGLTARYWIEAIAGLPCSVEIASEYRYRAAYANPKHLIVTISQSGETLDTMEALKYAKSLGHKHTLSICNVPESAIPRASELVCYTRAGAEIGVASTKAFTTQLAALFQLTVVLGKLHGRIDAAQEADYLEQLRFLPGSVQHALNMEPQIAAWAERFARKSSALFLGRGLHYPIALEGALKLKEISYIHAEAYPAGELKHGPLALVDEDMPVVVIAPNDSLLEKVKSNMQEVRARGGELFVFADQDSNFNASEGVHVIRTPRHAGVLSPIVHTIPVQLLAYHTALARGTDVDKPRNLAKSVTVE
ncbi:glutamine--fructose-6-phosphate transaminase (isomerizing) [Stenotrophomonas geniculata]|jgi:glucosamine--fructose-6-phosphate aminotransferase (isomerizing)|uniref:Glutamine--fructose-6-phosphate aminotransferase [isomerizing] n=2 Tax=Stenotrophomonas geniculata TaxID=86188 RepID=A0A0L8A5J6_9GAMM|nr:MULTISPECIES: glutamine--fructose-6-phosphate transaminase (isomerizing) [Stenotrophomonas]MBH1406154.1 glutamine--fructose-6-phosphate transaminase (isomerizing) [Stenotrophomonas maltophilia]HCL44953.1 glutamine--fructose-6-phosphate transaminase (isomerizing) [Pseudomonas sp.]KOE97663.1 glucosamine--fructose-6-phosphate aminotransferase [Stenotrophomonas geniculata N1]MBH1852814.1 glutamine--fructose-6-phosphate transaminase (isomerizing) [Stenotrophomonas maltophilia]MBN4970400.1 glutam